MTTQQEVSHWKQSFVDSCIETSRQKPGSQSRGLQEDQSNQVAECFEKCRSSIGEILGKLPDQKFTGYFSTNQNELSKEQKKEEDRAWKVRQEISRLVMERLAKKKGIISREERADFLTVSTELAFVIDIVGRILRGEQTI